MGKLPKEDSNNQPLDIPPQDPFEAKEAIRKGQVAPIGSYLRDLPEILTLLADQLDFKDGEKSRVKLRKIECAPEDQPSQEDPEEDWDSNTQTVLKYIEKGEATLVAWFLRDLASFLSDLGRVFDPKANSEIWKLTFSRRRRAGRP